MKAVIYRTYTDTVEIPDRVFDGVDMNDEYAVRNATLQHFQRMELPPVDTMVEVTEEREIELLEEHAL